MEKDSIIEIESKIINKLSRININFNDYDSYPFTKRIEFRVCLKYLLAVEDQRTIEKILLGMG